ncbi:hypothetical protein VDS18_00340 [Xanthomonas campestris pv. campestris]|nr:hypothetical protein [Xanthomonas campestris pv. campestris]
MFYHEGKMYQCAGFQDSKTRNKHFKKHVKGVPANSVGAGDLAHLNITDAYAYQQMACTFMNQAGRFHATDFPIVTLETSKGNIARWNQNSGLFGSMTPDGTLLTFHIRKDASQFQTAITDN